MARKRDDFSQPTIRELGKRVNYHCSRPDCWKPTLGPHSDPTKSVNLGKAAHITAASIGGPRYDENLSQAERVSILNGIWLCGIHAEHVDKDEAAFSVETLKKWKEEAEERARIEVFTNKSTPRGKVVIELDDEDRDFFASLMLPPEETTQTILPRMLAAAEKNIETYVSSDEWPDYVLPLNLTLRSAKASVTLDGLARGIGIAKAVNLVAAPGTGKTTMMIRLAETILDIGETVAVYIPLGEWNGQESWYEFLIRRNAYRSFKPEHFMQLAYEGCLVLLLDGWNELSPTARKQAQAELDLLKREFPQIGIVIGTRQQARPIDGATIRIDGLSGTQQMELARKLRNEDGIKLVDQAWRTPGIRELISIPLYLTALLSSASGAEFPKTKEAVLSSFVAHHEKKKAEILETELLGFQREMLEALAITANAMATPFIADDKARPAIADAVTALQASKQLTIGLEPTKVLNVLVDAHLLTRSPDGDGVVSFQHQQFQEWYASFKVEELMLAAEQGNTSARKELREEVLNWLAWEESILFACERLSRSNTAGSKAVAGSIIETLGIDPMLAAEMIFRSAPEVWTEINDKVIAFIQRWHQPGKGDRAARFMITSGKPEFAEQIWALIEKPDDQIYLDALRSANRFRPSVLGPNAEKRLAKLSDEHRGHVLAEIAGNSGYDGMELAAAMAKSDENPAVIVEILQSLAFWRADHHVEEILRAASNETWNQVALKGYPERLADPALEVQLAELRQKIAANETDPIKLVGYLNLGWETEDKSGLRLQQVIQSDTFPIKDDNGRSVIYRAYEKWPIIVATAFMHRLAAGLELPYNAHEMLESITTVDDGPITEAALNPATPKELARVACTVVGSATIGKLIDEFIGYHEDWRTNGQSMSEPARKGYQRTKDAITTSRQSAFLPTLLERANTDKTIHIEALADLVSQYGKDHERKPLILNEDDNKALAAVLSHWIDVLMKSQDATRHQMAAVVQAIERHPLPQFVPALHEMQRRDAYEWTQTRAEYFKSVRRGAMPMDVSTSWTLQYRRAFAAIGNQTVIELMKSYLPDLHFGFDAACVLMEIWNRDHPSGKDKRFSGYPDFSDVKARRARLEDAKEKPETSEFSEAIFDTVKKYAVPESDKQTQHHALKLAKIGISMPYGMKRDAIEALLALPQPFAAKREFMTVAAMMGEPLPAGKLLAAFNELLEAGKKEKWRLEERNGEIMGWVELFPFSDRPSAVLEILDQLPQEYRYPHHLRRLFTSLRDSPHPDSLVVLQALAAKKPELMDDHEWLAAIVDQKSLEAGKILIALICDGTIKLDKAIRGWGLVKQVAGYAEHYPDIRQEIMKRYETLADGPIRRLLEGAMIEVADESFILALIDNMAKAKRADDGRLKYAMEKLAIGQAPVPDWPGAFEHFSMPLNEFRKQLFAMVTANDSRSDLAALCLVKIDKLRDMHGRISDEAKHPDIHSGLSWPKAATEVKLLLTP